MNSFIFFSKYRIYPTGKQERELKERLNSCRILYNMFLSERKVSWETEKKTVRLYDQINQLPSLKLEIPNLRNVYSQVLQNVAVRVDFAHQESRKIINNYQIICVENLEVNRLKEHSFKCIAKSISDTGWNMFTNILSYKAVDAGRTVVFVNPAYFEKNMKLFIFFQNTSQDCSRCGHREKKLFSERIHHCKCCGLNIHRDLNASINIESLGLQTLGIKSLEATRACPVE